MLPADRIVTRLFVMFAILTVPLLVVYGSGGDGSLSGRITQSGVSNKFVMLVPVYVDFGQGWVKLGTAVLAGNTSVDLSNIKLSMMPKRAAICAMNDVLASSIQNSN